jgi:hypothetical protein
MGAFMMTMWRVGRRAVVALILAQQATMSGLRVRLRRVAALVGCIALLAPASALANGAHATATAATNPLLNGGGGFATTSSPVLAPPASPATPATGYCDGRFPNDVSNIDFSYSGYRLNWDFYLTTASQGFLGSPVEVTMPQAKVNGVAIQPPYGPHTEPNSYDFHSSLLNYNKLGGGSGTIQPGDTLYMYWDIYSFDGSGNAAYRYVNCRSI